MTKKLYEETNIQNIATAIRNKANTTTRYKVSEMAEAINGISSGSNHDYFLLVDTLEEAQNATRGDNYLNFIRSMEYKFNEFPTYINGEITIYCPGAKTYIDYYRSVIIRKMSNGTYSAVWIPEFRNNKGMRYFNVLSTITNKIYSMKCSSSAKDVKDYITNDVMYGNTLSDLSATTSWSSNNVPFYWSTDAIYDIGALISKLQSGELTYSSLNTTTLDFVPINDQYNIISSSFVLDYYVNPTTTTTNKCRIASSCKLARKVNIKSISEK